MKKIWGKKKKRMEISWSYKMRHVWMYENCKSDKWPNDNVWVNQMNSW